MQANRAVSMDEAPWPEPIPAREVVRLAGSTARAPVVSPALLLRAEIEARLGQADGAAALAEPGLAKWPMAARLAVIIGASLAAWSAIGFALAQVL
jgi:hypothetical protein